MEELQDVSFEVCQGELALLVGHPDPARFSAFWLEENSGSAGWSDVMAKCGFFVRGSLRLSSWPTSAAHFLADSPLEERAIERSARCEQNGHARAPARTVASRGKHLS